MKYKKEQYAWIFLRISLGLIFFWSFIDKLFGLGFSTCRDATTNTVEIMCQGAWLNGGSPTTGFLLYGTRGPLASLFNAMAGSMLVEWLFMLGLLLIGLALLLGIGRKIACYSGALMLMLMWLALLWPEHHPFLDEHIIYFIVLFGLSSVKAGNWWGFGKWWSGTNLVKKYGFLE